MNKNWFNQTIYTEDLRTRPYQAAHFANPKSRGARGECGRCGGSGQNYQEVRIGACWVPMCRGCFMEFANTRPYRERN